jgi:flagellar hook protein FlgE
MTISSSFSAGVAGLSVNAARLATISDNIANSATFGYKRASTEFSSMVVSNTRGAGTYSAGGVRASTLRLIEERGDLIGTGNALDLAIAGRGMLPVVSIADLAGNLSDLPMTMTRTGSFRTDANGILRTETGMVLLGWPADADGNIPPLPRDSSSGLVPVVINSNQTAADPTTVMNLGINLPATATEAGSTNLPPPLSVEYFDNLGTSESLEIEFIPIVPLSGASNQWTMQIRDTASGNAVIGEYTLTFDDTRGAGGPLLSVVEVSGGAYNPADGTLALTVGGGPMSVGIGRIGSPNGLTQLSDSFAPISLSKNGSPIGSITTVEVDQNGYINATYDTGFTRRLYQIPIVDVPNPNGLVALSNQIYKVSP